MGEGKKASILCENDSTKILFRNEIYNSLEINVDSILSEEGREERFDEYYLIVLPREIGHSIMQQSNI